MSYERAAGFRKLSCGMVETLSFPEIRFSLFQPISLVLYFDHRTGSE